MAGRKRKFPATYVVPLPILSEEDEEHGDGDDDGVNLSEAHEQPDGQRKRVRRDDDQTSSPGHHEAHGDHGDNGDDGVVGDDDQDGGDIEQDSDYVQQDGNGIHQDGEVLRNGFQNGEVLRDDVDHEGDAFRFRINHVVDEDVQNDAELFHDDVQNDGRVLHGPVENDGDFLYDDVRQDGEQDQNQDVRDDHVPHFLQDCKSNINYRSLFTFTKN